MGAQIERDEQLRTFQSFQNRFRAPYEQSLSTNPLYYSLDVGPIHIIMLNGVRPCSPSHGPVIVLTTPLPQLTLATLETSHAVEHTVSALRKL